MFEKEIKVIYDFSINEVRQLGSFFTYEELTSVDLHPAILKYVSAELDYLIYEDRYRLLSNSNFDYSGGRIAEYFSLIGEEIKRSKKFAFDYADNLILQAIAFNVNFLAQPNWALTKLIFEKENEVKTAELRQIINYIYFNDYLKAIIEKYLQKKNLQIISRQEFETILDKIDQELLASDPSKVFNLVLRAIGEFFNIGSVLKSRIPLYPFKLYLKEKKLQSFAVKLENAFRGEARQSCDIVELQNALFAPEVKKPIEQKVTEKKPSEKKPLVPKHFVPRPWEQMPSVQKPVEQKPLDQKPVEKKPLEEKSFEEKPFEEQPFRPKPEVPKPPVQKPVVQNGENYLDRIMRQEKPATFFSFGNPGEEEQETNPPAEAAASEKEMPEEKIPQAEEIPQVEEIPAVKEDIPAEAETLPEEGDAASEVIMEEDSVVLELSEEEIPSSELEFEEVEEPAAPVKDNEAEPAAPQEIAAEPVVTVENNAQTAAAEENAAEENEAEENETEELFSGINIDNIDIDITEEQEDKEVEESASGFFSRFKRKGRSGKENKKLEDFSIGEFTIDETGITIEDETPPEQIREVEEEAVDSDPVNTFSRIFSVISEVFSKREQEKIISEIFSNRAEKFAKAFYNIITEAHDALQAEGLVDMVLKSNGIDESNKWARVFKKNILQYFKQD